MEYRRLEKATRSRHELMTGARLDDCARDDANNCVKAVSFTRLKRIRCIVISCFLGASIRLGGLVLYSLFALHVRS